MIQPNELRLGNKINHNGIVCTILGIDSNSWLQLDNEQLNTRCDDCEYIPLTEEWLLKAGFEKNESRIATSYSISISPYKTLKELVVFIQQGNEYVHIREGERSKPSTVDTITTILNGDIHGRPFHVNQLQNLFFALTGKELEFKL